MRQNYKFTISYDGTRYQGWERQPSTDMTIQGKLEAVLSRMAASADTDAASNIKTAEVRSIKTAEGTDAVEENPAVIRKKYNESEDVANKEEISAAERRIEVIGAGRTDAGVHARSMIANAFMDVRMGPDEIRDYMNRYLPDDICIKEVKIASDRFHSRYNATGKTYRYTCFTGPIKPVFDRKYVYYMDETPDIDRMKRAAELLKGEHDYKSFCSNPRMKKSTVRKVDRIDIARKGSYITFTYHGTGFLQYMVRIMTGTLLEVGLGKRDPESMTELLEAKDRRIAGATAPAMGLTMISVDYA